MRRTDLEVLIDSMCLDFHLDLTGYRIVDNIDGPLFAICYFQRKDDFLTISTFEEIAHRHSTTLREHVSVKLK